MKIFKILIIFLLFTDIAHTQSDQTSNILKNIRCLICQGQSVYDSESDFASSIKIIVDKKINEGSSEDQIYHFLKEKYGEWIVYNPKLNKNTYILWLLPLLLFLVGGAIILKKLNNQK